MLQQRARPSLTETSKNLNFYSLTISKSVEFLWFFFLQISQNFLVFSFKRVTYLFLSICMQSIWLYKMELLQKGNLPMTKESIVKEVTGHKSQNWH